MKKSETREIEKSIQACYADLTEALKLGDYEWADGTAEQIENLKRMIGVL